MGEFGESGDLLGARHYYWGACFLCGRKSSPGNLMKRCSRCKCVFYCSQDHQKKSWKEHKHLCKYMATSADNAEQFNFFSGFITGSRESWKTFRMNAIQTCEILLSTTLSLAEKEIFLFPRACRTCNISQEVMIDCAKCYCVSYCSAQHKEEDKEDHKEMCRPLRLAMLADTYESQVGIGVPAIPSELDAKYLGSAPDITHFLPEPFRSQNNEISKAELEHCFSTCQLSGALTILHAIDTFRPSLAKKKTLRIHIVGANIYEMLGIIKWEYLLHRLPDVESLEFDFVGPDLEEDEDGDELDGQEPSLPPCQDCTDRNRRVRYGVHSTRYTNFKRRNKFVEPDVVLVQNAGFSEYDDTKDAVGWVEGWSDLPQLVPKAEALLIFTSYTSSEARKDLQRLQKYCDVKVLVSELNPMRSHRPCRDWERDGNKDVFYSNHYYTVVQQNVAS